MPSDFTVSMLLTGAVSGALLGALGTTSDKIKRLGTTQEKLTGKTARYQAALGKLKAAQDRTGDSTGKIGTAMARLERKIEKVSTASAKAQRRLTRLRKAESARGKRAELQGDLMGVAGMVASVAAPVMAAVNFESAMVDVNKNVKGIESVADQAAMAQAIRQVARNSPMAHEGVARLVSEAGKIGMGKDAAISFAKTAEKIGTAFDITADAAGSQLTKIMGQMGLSVDGVAHLADAVNYLGDNSKSNAANITQILATSGGVVAASTNLAKEEVAALAAVIDGVSPNAETASTALKNMTYALTLGDKASGVQKSALEDLGLSATDLAARMQTDAKGAIMEVMEALGDVEDSERAGVMESLFGRESLGAIAPLINDTGELARVFGLVSDAQTYAGSVDGEYQRKLASTEAQLKLFKGQLYDLGVSVGKVLVPPLRMVTSILGTVFGLLGSLVDRFPVLSSVVFGLVGAIVAFKVAALAGAYAMTFFSGTGTMLASVFSAIRGSTMLCTAAQWALNVAMTANPIGLIVAGVTALAAVVWRVYSAWDKLVSAWRNSAGIVDGIIGVTTTFFGLGDDEHESSSANKANGPSQNRDTQVGTSQGTAFGTVQKQQTSNVTFNITQQPGEDGDTFARRVADEMNRPQTGLLYDG